MSRGSKSTIIIALEDGAKSVTDHPILVPLYKNKELMIFRQVAYIIRIVQMLNLRHENDKEIECTRMLNLQPLGYINKYLNLLVGITLQKTFKIKHIEAYYWDDAWKSRAIDHAKLSNWDNIHSGVVSSKL